MKTSKALALLSILTLCFLSVLMLSACSQPISIDGLSFEGASYVYDGTLKSISVKGLPEGAALTYDAATSYTDVGVYPVTATITTKAGDNIVLKSTLTITKAQYDTSNIHFNSKEFNYDGSSKSIEIDGTLPDGVTVSYEGNDKTDAGSYTVVAKFNSTNPNYEQIPDRTAVLSIKKAKYDLSNVTLKSQAFIYDGTDKYISVNGTLPDGVTVSYEGNDKSGIGSHLVTAKFTSNNPNYEPIPNMTATYIIYNANGLPFYEVIFDSNGGSDVEGQTVLHGSYVNAPANPTRGEDIFVGWYFNDISWNFNSRVVDKNITLVAKWQSPYSYYQNNSGGITLSGYRGSKTEIVFPETIDGLTVTEIDRLSVPENTTSITLPNTVKIIKTKAFVNLKNVKSLVIPYGVEVIEENAFGYNYYDGDNCCASLESIELPESLKTIGQYAFYGCTALKSIKFPGSLEEIPAYVLSKCTALTSVEISSGTKKICDYAFNNCESLKTLTIADSVSSLGSNVFYGCSSIEYNTKDSVRYIGSTTNPYLILVQGIDSTATSIKIQDGVRFILPRAFENFSKLTSVTLPNTVTYIGAYAFSKCSAMESINLPSGITKISNYTFNCCSKLKSIDIPSNVDYIGSYAFYSCGSIEEIDIPDSVITFGKSAFEGASKLKKLNIGVNSKLENIGEDFIVFTNIETIYIPKNVKRLDTFTIYNSDLTTVIIGKDTQLESIAYLATWGSIKTVYFGGDAEDWIDIDINSDNGDLLNATRYYYSETKPSDISGNYWYYDEKTNSPVIW